MSHIPIWSRTAEAKQDILPNRFVDPLGTLGGSTGVVISPCNKGGLCSIITVGEADVEIASGQTIALGDLVKGDANGCAVKSTDTSGAYVLEVKDNVVKVLLRG